MNISNGYRKYGFDAYGDKVLKKEDMAYWMDNPQRVDPKGISFELGAGIEEVEEGFFTLVPTINELFILNPECNVIMTDETIGMFQANDVLIRGAFDGAAEEFARKYNLRFLHSNVQLASVGDYYSASGVDTITLCFRKDGSAYINQDNSCMGSSAGWSGGGEINFELPNKFYANVGASGIADKCWSSCSGEIKKNGILKELLEKARNKGGFFISYK